MISASNSIGSEHFFTEKKKKLEKSSDVRDKNDIYYNMYYISTVI